MDSISSFRELETQKAALLRRIETWSAARLAYRPGAGEWSAVEVVDHLVKVEAAITDATRKGWQAPHRRGLRDRLGFVFLDYVFRSRRRVKAPSSAPQILPAPGVSLDEVRERWDASRQELSLLLAQIPPDRSSAGVFRHPVSGWMTVPQVLRFFSVHIHHHGFQIDRLEEASAHLSSMGTNGMRASSGENPRT